MKHLKITSGTYQLLVFYETFVSLLLSTILLVEGRIKGRGTLHYPFNDEICNPDQHRLIMDPVGKFIVEWIVNSEEETIYFNVTVETVGFIEFGIAKKDNISHADLIIGGVDASGTSYFSDRHASKQSQTPVVDDKQDWILQSARESKSHTFLSFSRPLQTCDDQDISINNDDTTILLWGYGFTDNLDEYSQAVRGEVPRHLLDSDLTPKAVRQTKDPSKIEQDLNIKIWTMKTSFHIPTKRTTYWCQIHKLSLPHKHHIIGFGCKIDNQTLENIHHRLLYRCIGKNLDQVYERFIDHPGEECYNPLQQIGEIPFHTCFELKAGYSIGGHPIFFPDTVGIPIGSTGENEYYLLQTHYDNPTGRDDLISENQLDIYYTSNLRANDGGIMNVGHHVPGSPGILLPPRVQNSNTGIPNKHKIFGHCSSLCSEKILPPEGIKVVAVLLHSHSAGDQLALKHFRGNQELRPILEDSSFINTYQPWRLLRDEVSVLPGDQISLQCVYDTTLSNHSVVGGYSVLQEMCLSFVIHYPFLEHYPVCRSELTDSNYIAKYLAGTSNATWNHEKLEFQATAPAQVAGKVFSEISDQFVDWSVDKRAELTSDHLLLKQIGVCPKDKEILEYVRTGDRGTNTYATYPVLAKKYNPPSECNFKT